MNVNAPTQNSILQFLIVQQQQALVDTQTTLILAQRRRRTRQVRSCWVRPWLSADRRLQFGHYDRLMAELRLEDDQSFCNFMRMLPAMFDEIKYYYYP